MSRVAEVILVNLTRKSNAINKSVIERLLTVIQGHILLDLGDRQRNGRAVAVGNGAVVTRVSLQEHRACPLVHGAMRLKEQRWSARGLKIDGGYIPRSSGIRVSGGPCRSGAAACICVGAVAGDARKACSAAIGANDSVISARVCVCNGGACTQGDRLYPARNGRTITRRGFIGERKSASIGIHN